MKILKNIFKLVHCQLSCGEFLKIAVLNPLNWNSCFEPED